MTALAPPDISVVVPVRNEADNLRPLIEEVVAALAGRAFEIVYVNDGSTDDTLARLIALKAEVPQLRVMTHAQSCGQSAAVRTGIMAARGRLIGTLDGDCQNNPADLPAMIDQIEAPGADPRLAMIAGDRSHRRRDTQAKRIASRLANRIRSRALKDNTPDTGCGIKVFRRDAFLRLPYFDHMHRFLPALMQREGYLVENRPVDHRPRGAGRSNYTNFGRLMVSIRDLLGVMWLVDRMKRPHVRED